MVFKSSVNNGGGSSGVSSLNTLTGALSLTSSNITITPNAGAGTIDIESTAGGGNVNTTGSPALGNIAIFSGSATITNGNLAGDVTTSGSPTVTLATVNANVGTWGSSSSVPVITVNAKGLTTGVSTASYLGSALSGTSLASGIINSSLTKVGTLATATWQATTIALNYGGTAANLSATGGTSQVLQQSSTGAAVTVGQIAASDLSNGTTGSGSVVLTTAPTMSNPIVGTQSTSDNSTKAASTAYVTTAVANAIAGVNPAVAVVAATTQASDTSGLTYNNGVSGIGATLTGSNNTAITFDGQTLTSLNQRVLVKNDTQSPSGAFNGIYYLTQLQTAILPPILTRALDYDQSSDINSTGAIPVVNGTVNANTSWLLTSTVNTVGTDPLTYVQFSIAPSTIATLTGTQTLTNKRITRRLTSVTQSATPSINTDNMTIANITGLAQAITSMTTNLTGTPNDGDLLEIRITDNGTPRAITWGASFASTTVTLPTTTVASTMLRTGLEWNSTASVWQCIATA